MAQYAIHVDVQDWLGKYLGIPMVVIFVSGGAAKGLHL
jgi:hypothetical protein